MNFLDELTRFVSEEILEGRAVSPEEDLLLTGLVDSIGIMSLVVHIETSLGIEVPPEDIIIENFASIRDIDRYLRRRSTSNV